METGYETFVEALRQALIAATGFDEEKIYFEKKGGRFTGSSDRLFVECAVYEDAREVCGIYTEDLYERYQEDITLEDIVREVLLDVRRAQNSQYFQKTRNLSDYHKVKGDLFIRLLNADRNREELKYAVFQTVGDIALVLYLKVSEEDGCVTSIKIRDEYVEKWGISQERAIEEALLNTYFLSPPRIYQWEKLFFDPEYGGENFMDIVSGYEINKEAVGNCLSTTKRTNGAVAVFLPGVAERLAKLIGSGFYLVFTSIHEVMIHNDKKVAPEDLVGVLKDTLKEATPEEDYLTSRIYHYNSDRKEFTCVC
ncbi:MAG: DUF5688 family protein [Eubacteriales bacterium]|nr:DUF5688 family protein [Eubacteriales bacterium]